MDGSLGYASRLSHREDLGGQLGAPELSETAQSHASKVKQLAQLVRSAQHLVVFTGAGISTSVGIPDFRGPTGVWTQQRRGKPPPKAAVPFSQARPSLTHQALLGLQARPQKPMTPPLTPPPTPPFPHMSHTCHTPHSAHTRPEYSSSHSLLISLVLCTIPQPACWQAQVSLQPERRQPPPALGLPPERDG